MTLIYHFISLRCASDLLKTGCFSSHEGLRTMSACSIKSIKSTCIISQCLPHNRSLSRAVPEEANKGPSLLEASQVNQKEPNTIFVSVDPLNQTHNFTSQEKRSREEKRAPRYLFFSLSQVPYLKRH